MNLNTLKDFRQHVLKCFTRAGDALFNTMDALSSETTAHSFPELSLSPLFERKWPSQYAAFKDGKIDAKLLREVFVQFAPVPSPGSRSRQDKEPLCWTPNESPPLNWRRGWREARC